MLRSLYTAAAVFAVAGAANAAPVAFFDQQLEAGWNIGNGQFPDHFSGVRDGQFGTGKIELGLRAQKRFTGPYTPVMTPSLWGTLPMYTTTPGISSGVDNAIWNFDGSVAYSGGNATLDNVSITLAPVWGDVQALNPYSQSGMVYTVWPGSQFSQNPGFGEWSGPGNFDTNATGLYLITLSATENGQTVSTQILVNVGNVAVPTPEPVSLVVFGSLVVGATVAVWRRQAKRA
jgi:hypothetical protein